MDTGANREEADENDKKNPKIKDEVDQIINSETVRERMNIYTT